MRGGVLFISYLQDKLTVKVYKIVDGADQLHSYAYAFLKKKLFIVLVACLYSSSIFSLNETAARVLSGPRHKLISMGVLCYRL